MAKKRTVAKKHTATAHVLMRDKKQEEKREEFSFAVTVANEHPAVVVYHRSETYNLGDYESRKIEVGVHMPCVPTPDGVDAAWAEAEAWVDERIELTSARLNKAGE